MIAFEWLAERKIVEALARGDLERLIFGDPSLDAAAQAREALTGAVQGVGVAMFPLLVMSEAFASSGTPGTVFSHST